MRISCHTTNQSGLSYWDGGSHTADWGVVQEGNPKTVLSRQDWQMVSLEASEVSSAFAVVTSLIPKETLWTGLAIGMLATETVSRF